MLWMADISSMDDIQNLFRETIAEFMDDGLDNEYRPIRTALGVYTKSEIAPAESQSFPLQTPRRYMAVPSRR